MKPAIRMAYKSSKGVDPRDNMEDSFVEYPEFRILMVNIRRYIELFAAFEAVDDGDDNRINLKEFESSIGMLKEWGITVDDAEATFNSIDTNGGGQVLFNEFAGWAITNGLDYDDDLDAGNLEAVKTDVSNVQVEEYDAYVAPTETKKTYEKIELDDIATKLPVGRSEADIKQRKEMFEGMDKSDNGQLSLAEIDLGILEYLGSEFHLMKPAIRMAYKSSKGVDPRDNMEDSFVEYPEFRILMVNIRRYIELFAAFEAVDDGDDNRINLKEFESSIGMLKEWGITVDDAEATFNSIDTNGGGQVLFNEFAGWAITNGLDYDDDLDAGNLEAVKTDVSNVQVEEYDAYEAPVETKTAKKYEKVELDEIAGKLPVGRSNEDAVKRKNMFDTMDKSGNGQLSLAEIDLGILEFLGSEFHIMKPAIRMAYKSSKDVDPRENMEDSFVEFAEFRLLMVNIRRYIELFAAFDAVDDGDDNRINLEEFATSLGMLKEWGIEVSDAEASFKQIDLNGGGQILFNEFAAWALKNGLDYDKDLDAGDATKVLTEVDVPDRPKEPVIEEEVESLKVDIDPKVFQRISAALPVSNSEEHKKARKTMFDSADVSGSGQLSLAEIQSAILTYLGEEVAAMTPAIIMAYKVSKDSRGTGDADYVERKEMKTLLICLRRYLELWIAFESIDTSDDRRIGFEEFSKATSVLESWEVKVEDPKAEFDAMDSDNGGYVRFQEFCSWALKKNLDVSDDLD